MLNMMPKEMFLWNLVSMAITEAENRYGLTLYGRVDHDDVIRLASHKLGWEVYQYVDFKIFGNDLDLALEFVVQPLLRKMAEIRDKK